MAKCITCNIAFEANNRHKYCEECKKTCKYCDRPRSDRGAACNSCRGKKSNYKYSDKDLAYVLNKKTCDCCGNDFKSHKDKSQDHCHTTGNLRGLVCQRCNWTIGMYETTEKDNIINYLIKFTRTS
jgi:hypothetical protein